MSLAKMNKKMKKLERQYDSVSPKAILKRKAIEKRALGILAKINNLKGD